MGYRDHWSRPCSAAGRRSLICNLSQVSCRVSGRAVNGAPREVRFVQVCGVNRLENLALRPCLTFGLGVGILSALFKDDTEVQDDLRVFFSWLSGGDAVASVDGL